MRAPYSLALAAFCLVIAAMARQHLISQDECSGPASAPPKTWWRAEIQHNGTTPYSTDPSYKYYRTVLDYGADNTGANDTSGAFNEAIHAWSRAGNTVTTRPAYIYVPPGIYLIKQPIQILVYTSLVGDALNPPILVADPALGDRPVINGYDEYQGDNGATKNFYMAVRNFKIDTRRVPGTVMVKGMEWSVSQSCSLTNIHITMPRGSSHIGIAMNKGGSAIIVSDCSFSGGAVGMEVGSQQYLLKSLSFDGCTVGIFMKWAFVVTIQGAKFTNCRYGIDTGREKSAGAMSVVDSSVSKCEAGVLAYVSGTGQNSLVLDNFEVRDAIAVKSPTGATLLGGSVAPGQTWVLGNTIPHKYQAGAMYPVKRPSALLVNGKYFTAPIPQYEKYSISQVVSVKGDSELPVYGDNSHDDGPSINAILRKHAGCKVVFFPQGIYQTRSTIQVPPGSRLVGEVFSTISGMGSFFANADKPQPIVQLGKDGDKGVAHLSDILVSAGDVLPGAVLMQINMAGTNPGDVGLWNVVLRVGGSNDTLVNTKCSGTDLAACKAAFALMHITKNASAYLEDVWGWVADHGLDPHLNPTTTPQNIAVARGALIESTAATWLIGTSFEHCVLYQYALHRAENVYVALQQTESPYWQGTGTPLRAPAPWKVEASYGDPTFDHCAADDDQCRRAWAHHGSDSSNVVIHGSALWVFYNRMLEGAGPDGHCAATGEVCQANMVGIASASSTFWYSLATKSVGNMVYDVSGGGLNRTVQREHRGSWGGVVAAYLRWTEEKQQKPSGGPNGDGNPGKGGENDKKEDSAESIKSPGWTLISTALALTLLHAL